MKSCIAFILFSLLLSTGLCAQQLRSVSNDGRAPFTYDGEILSHKELIQILETDDQSLTLVKQSKGNGTIGNIFGYAGGYLVGQEIGKSLFGNRENGKTATVGLAAGGSLIALALSINGVAKRQMRAAVRTYNKNEVRGLHPNHPVTINAGITADGVGLTFRF